MRRQSPRTGKPSPAKSAVVQALPPPAAGEDAASELVASVASVIWETAAATAPPRPSRNLQVAQAAWRAAQERAAAKRRAQLRAEGAATWSGSARGQAALALKAVGMVMAASHEVASPIPATPVLPNFYV